MRDWDMVSIAKKMDDLYMELREVHEYDHTGAMALTVAAFTGRLQKTS